MNLLLLIVAIITVMFGFVVFRGSPYVPSRRKDIRQSLHELYQLNSNDLLVDIGSGDGIVLREAAKIGAKAIGYEINPILVILSRFLSRKYKNIRINFADFWSSKLPDDTTVIYVFSASRDMNRIMKNIQTEANRLKKSMNVISYGSEFNNVKPSRNVGAYHLYVVKPLQSSKAQV